MALEGLVNEFGPLAKTVPMFQEGTWQTSAEIAKERITNRELRNIWLWTANFGMYTVENDEEFLYFGGREANLIFNNIGEAAKQLLENQNYKPTPSEIQAVHDSVQARHTLKVKLSDLSLTVDNDEWCHFSIDTANWQNMNDTQKLFAERVYGSMKEREDPQTKKKASDFAEYMEELRKAGKTTTNVYVLNPTYVKSHVPEGGALVRACWLDGFGYDSDFDAGGRGVDYANGALRGVRRVRVAEGDTAQKAYEAAYQKIVGQPHLIKPDQVAGLARVVSNYLDRQKTKE